MILRFIGFSIEIGCSSSHCIRCYSVKYLCISMALCQSSSSRADRPSFSSAMLTLLYRLDHYVVMRYSPFPLGVPRYRSHGSNGMWPRISFAKGLPFVPSPNCQCCCAWKLACPNMTASADQVCSTMDTYRQFSTWSAHEDDHWRLCAQVAASLCKTKDRYRMNELVIHSQSSLAWAVNRWFGSSRNATRFLRRDE